MLQLGRRLEVCRKVSSDIRRSRSWGVSAWCLKQWDFKEKVRLQRGHWILFSHTHSWLATCPWPAIKEQGCQEVDAGWGHSAGPRSTAKEVDAGWGRSAGPRSAAKKPSSVMFPARCRLFPRPCCVAPVNLPERKHWACFTPSVCWDAFFLQMRAYQELSKLKLQGLSLALVGAPPCSINLFCCKIFKSHIL